MTASPPVTPTDAANRAAPISFARWALGVLVPLLAYVALVFVLMGERSWSVGAYLVPIVYVAVFIYRYGILNGCRRAHAVAAAAFVALRSKKGPPWRCKKGPLGGCGLVP